MTPEDMKNLKKEWLNVIHSEFTTEELLAKLTPEERLMGMGPEELLATLEPEEIEAYLLKIRNKKALKR
ncbi:MAG: hypothetical protein B6245_04675 [Desulfobacteraceae bacterium 4572_88]|nr:MAG: hypothetical protein B6245_04675 [Desulfobacteraceae bacterium 4572_88]